MSGELYVFSGIDCAGKSTHIDALVKFFGSRDVKHRVVWSRVGYTPGIEALKKIYKVISKRGIDDAVIREETNSSVTKRKILALASIIDLALFYGVYFRWLSLLGYVIVADRYLQDSCIDLHIKYHDLDVSDWWAYGMLCKLSLSPNKALLLSITPEESMRRSELKYEPWPENLEQRRIRLGLYGLGRFTADYILVDCEGSIHEIQKNIFSELDLK